MKLESRDWGLIFIFALLRLFLSLKYSLGVDEAHYAIFGLHPELSYFDHPPLVGWVNFIFISIFGINDWVIRLPAILSGIVSSVLVFKLVMKISKNPQAARWGVFAINVSFLCFGLFLMFLPDTLLLPLSLWLIFIVLNLLENNSWRNWLTLGLCLGLCGLTKYTAILFIPSLIAISLIEKTWKQWLSIKFVVGSLLALLCVMPVLYWNWQHDWISFAYQTNHVVGANQYSLQNFLSSLVSQILAYSPFLVISSLATLVLCKNKSRITRISLWMVIPCMLFFLYSGFKGFVLPHWSLVFFVVFFACAFAEGFKQLRLQKALKLSTLLSLAVLSVVLVELFFNVIPFSDHKSPYADVVGWHEIHDQIKEYKEKHPELKLSIGIPHWTLGGRSQYYLSDVAPVFILDERYDQFDIWQKGQAPHGDLILLQWKGFEFLKPLDKMCQSTEVVRSNLFKIKNYIVTSADIVLCRGYSSE